MPLAILLAACGDSKQPPRDAGQEAQPADADRDGTAEADAGRDAGASCQAPDAAVFPSPAAGHCGVIVQTEEAERPTGDDGRGGWIVPGGRRVTRVGRQIVLSGLPLAILRIPGTPYAVVTDGGVGTEFLSVIDLDRGEVTGRIEFRPLAALFYGLARQGRRVFASGGGTGDLLAFDVAADGTIAAVPGAGGHFPREASPLGDDDYLGGLAMLADGRTLAVVGMFTDSLIVWDTDGAREVSRVALPAGALPYAVEAAPDGALVYVTSWASASVYVVDTAAGRVVSTIAVEKNPEGLAVSPDGRYLAVANSDSDSVSIVDTAMRAVVETVSTASEDAPRGASPVEPAWSADGTRLYVANAGDNAVDVFAFEGARADRVGRIPTMWYPTDVALDDDGRVLVVSGKHEGTGPNDDPGHVDITDLIHGSVAVVDPPTDAQLADWEIEIASNNRRPMGFARVDCGGASNDFPVPPPGGGPSGAIRHVVVVVRENKTYDAYYGDLTGAGGAPHGNGDPDLALLAPDEMERILPNTRHLALEFANLDNFFSGGEQSLQGHIWTTYGRTTDFVERSYPTTWGRAFWGIPRQGVDIPLSVPEEGSLWRWLAEQHVDFKNYGEIVASGEVPEGASDAHYPGLVTYYRSGTPDIDKARYLQRVWADRCAMPTVSVVLLPNDHTFGGEPGRPTPRSMLADNDEGVGQLVDAISHSTYWPETAIFILEDDPQTGGDHVDNHRSPALVISPWVRRGYVSSVHYHESSVWRTIQLILGIDRPPNAYVETAAPMLDVFASTPDYTPYTYTPRRWPVETNPGGTRFAIRSMAMDFSMPDRAAGLPQLLWEMLRGTPAPWRAAADDDD